MRKLTLAPTLTLILALTACGQQRDEPSPQPDKAALPIEADGAPDESATPPALAGDEAGAATIPIPLQGRWGMVPADCTSTRGHAKGLLTIGPRQLRLYESVATLELETARSERMIRGQFEFTGEGMTWTRDETLSVSGDTLTRTSRGGDEPGSEGPFTYSRCAA